MTHLVLPGIKASSPQDDGASIEEASEQHSPGVCQTPSLDRLSLSALCHRETRNTKFTFSLGAPQSYSNSVVGLM